MIPNLEPLSNNDQPQIDKEDTEFPVLPSTHKSKAPKQLKRRRCEIETSTEINEIPAVNPPTKKQRIQFSKLLKRIHAIFNPKEKVKKKEVRNRNESKRNKKQKKTKTE